ncbi:MAG: hypothetical protein GY729_01160, partial [Desulfobacteraceae bacterium]|nr:hypothetical protein [Desulfobacteraceae bacterium]
MENEDLFKKVLAFAESGKGRRLLNALISKNSVFTSSQMDELLKVYCKIGLPKEVESLKKRRGILGDDQYNALA